LIANKIVFKKTEEISKEFKITKVISISIRLKLMKKTTLKVLSIVITMMGFKTNAFVDLNNLFFFMFIVT